MLEPRGKCKNYQNIGFDYIYIYIEEFNYCMFSNAMNWGENWVIIGMFGHQTQMLFMCLNTKNGEHK